ncbi:MAG: hypothetical protein ACM3SU_17805 [Acidobacteriota bacterium]
MNNGLVQGDGIPGRRDLLLALTLGALGVGSRLAFLSVFPTLPISDFQGLIRFGQLLRNKGLSGPGWLWTQFNPGLPMLLSVLYRALPSGGREAARDATAIVTGLLGLLPFLLWRGVISVRLRFLAGLLLALWPGQVFFSGVVAQDNWVLFPTVALACLAVRASVDRLGRCDPIASGLLFAGAVAIRQEMLAVLLPLALAASLAPGKRLRASAIRLALAAVLPLLMLAWQRHAATGRFALTTEHAGLALLGTVVPSAWFPGWVDPRPYVASVEPELLGDVHRLYDGAARLAWREYRRRPVFHALRMGDQTFRLAIDGDGTNLFWSLEAAGVLPVARQADGIRFARAARPWLRAEMAILQGLFAAALALGAWKRDRAVLALAAAVVLKIGVHALFSPMSRLLVPATALELLTIPAAARLLPVMTFRGRTALGAVAIAAPLALLAVVPRLDALVSRHDRDDAHSYRFPLQVAGVGGLVWCDMDSGRLTVLDWDRATIQIRAANPAPGDRARAVCTLPPLSAGESIVLRLEDRYSGGGLPNRIVERVAIDGREVLSHDVAAVPFAGWLEVPMARDQDSPGHRVTIEIVAVSPDPGAMWGAATAATFEFQRTP